MTKHGTAIEWTHIPGTKGETWNPIRARNKGTGNVGHFCIHVDAGCKNCYAERLQVRFKNPVRYAAQDAEKVDVYLDEKTLLRPLHWLKPRTIFVCSMTDLFAEFVSDEWLDKIFAVMALCPQHTFIVLTKRPDRMRGCVISRDNGDGLPAGDFWSICAELSNRDPLECWPLPNVWLGTSVSDQASADKRVPYLLATPAAIRFVSYEPALGPVDFRNIAPCHGYASNALEGWKHDFGVPIADLPSKLDQIIAGGESGPGARPAHPDWFRTVRDQCAATGVSFFFKQWGEYAPDDGLIDYGNAQPVTLEGGVDMWRLGKKQAGCELDGDYHREFPNA